MIGLAGFAMLVPVVSNRVFKYGQVGNEGHD